MYTQFNKIIQKKVKRVLIAIFVILLLSGIVYVYINYLYKFLAREEGARNGSITQVNQKNEFSGIDGSNKLDVEKSGDQKEYKEKISKNKQLAMKVYINKKYNFSIQYPEYFFNLGLFEAHPAARPAIAVKSFSSAASREPLEMGDDISIDIRISENKNGGSLAEWAAQTPTNPNGTFVSQVKYFTINNQRAIRQVEDFTKTEGSEPGYSEVTYIKNKGYMYSIKGVTRNKKIFDNFRKEYNAMAASFRLVD